MNGQRTRGTRRVGAKAAAAAVSAGIILLASACGGSTDSAESADGLPGTVTIPLTVPLTGAAGFAGTSADKGYDLAVKEINDSDFLEGTTLKLGKTDTKSTPQEAASSLSSAIANKSTPAVLGSLLSAESVAQSPLAEKQKMPIVYIQAGSDGVLVGDYTYRLTAPQPSYYPIIEQYLEEKGAKRIGIVYGSWVPTIKQLGNESVPAAAKAVGAEIVERVETQQTTQDFSAPISKVLAADPDVVAILQIGAANATAMKQLREAGFDGPVIGNSSAGAGSLKPAGAAGAGMVWPVDFDHESDDVATAKFVDLYQGEYDEEPLPYAAEAYDAVWFIARALKDAGTTDREAVKDAMQVLVGKPFTGALGTDQTFDGNDLRVPGVVVEWDGAEEKLLYAAK
jgi:branched-chain amino acid transport system substrate-binding protein